MLSNLKSSYSSSQDSLKILNHIQIQSVFDQHLSNRDLFDQLLDQNTTKQYEQLNIMSQSIQQLHLTPPHQSAHQSACKCSKIDCLKLYCQCFAKGKLCNSSCECVCCGNTSGNQNEIYKAKQQANFRHHGYFKGIPQYIPSRKCTCKKSQCQKKYCQCFSGGLKCTDDCQCINCHNQKPLNSRNGDQISSIIEIQVNG